MVAAALDTLGGVLLAQGNAVRAQALLLQSLALSQDVGDKLASAYTLTKLARATCVQAQPARAATLFGAAEAVRSVINALLPPTEQTVLDQHIATTRTQLEEGTWQQAWAEGRAMSLEQAIAYALEDEVTPGVGK